MTDKARRAIHTPPETSRLTVQRIEAMAKNAHRRMPLKIDRVGTYLAPLMPGDICGIMAQTSNYKTGFMTGWAETLAGYLKSQGREDEVIFYADTENTVEALGMAQVARYSSHSVADLSRGNVRDWAKVIQAADRIADVQIYRVAASLGRDDVPDLYLSNIYRAISHAVNGDLFGHPLKPACIFIDYLQALPLDPEVKRSTRDIEKQRRLQVREDVYRIRRMANHLDCPIVVGVQAKQVLSWHAGPNMMIPGIYDGEETSAIGQRFDRLLSLWMPKMTHTVGDWLKHGDLRFEVAENDLWVKVLKQRGGLPSGRAWHCKIDFGTNMIRPANGAQPAAGGGV